MKNIKYVLFLMSIFINSPIAAHAQNQAEEVNVSSYFDQEKTIDDLRSFFENALANPSTHDLFPGKIWLCHHYILTEGGLYSNDFTETFKFSQKPGLILSRKLNKVPSVYLRTESDLTGVVDSFLAPGPELVHVRRTEAGDLIAEWSFSDEEQEVSILSSYKRTIGFFLRYNNISENNWHFFVPVIYPSIAIQGGFTATYLFCPKAELSEEKKSKD